MNSEIIEIRIIKNGTKIQVGTIFKENNVKDVKGYPQNDGESVKDYTCRLIDILESQ